MRFDEINCFCFQNAHSSYLRTCAHLVSARCVWLLMFRIVIFGCILYELLCLSVCLLCVYHTSTESLTKNVSKNEHNFSVQLIKMKSVCMKFIQKENASERRSQSSCWDLCVLLSKLLNHVLISFETNFFHENNNNDPDLKNVQFMLDISRALTLPLVLSRTMPIAIVFTPIRMEWNENIF